MVRDQFGIPGDLSREAEEAALHESLWDLQPLDTPSEQDGVEKCLEMCPASALHILKAVSSSWHDSVRRVLHSTVWKTRCAHEALEDLRAKPVSVDIDDGMTIKIIPSERADKRLDIGRPCLHRHRQRKQHVSSGSAPT